MKESERKCEIENRDSGRAKRDKQGCNNQTRKKKKKKNFVLQELIISIDVTQRICVNDATLDF